jgi:hypothetical protein
MKLNSHQRFQFFLLPFLFFFLMVTADSFAQNNLKGKIIPLTQADSLFGPVQQTIRVSAADVRTWLAQTDSVIMFAIRDSQLVVLGDARKLITPVSVEVKADDVFHLFSKSKLEELLSTGTDEIILYEQRTDVLTITDGTNVLEFSYPCPPVCD